jgi:mannose-6-phosphate isomerase-like protein (cupin superfamily)
MQRRKFLSTAILTSGATLVSGQLLASEKQDIQKPFVTKAGKARFEDFNPVGVLKVSGKDTNNEYCVFEMKNEIGPMAGPPLHIHKYQDEVFQIIEGEFLFQVGTEKFKASTGDFVFAPRKLAHTFYQLSKKAHLIFSYNPAGKMEVIMKEMIKLMPNNPEAFAKVCAKNDVPFVGPPLTGE